MKKLLTLVLICTCLNVGAQTITVSGNTVYTKAGVDAAILAQYKKDTAYYNPLLRAQDKRIAALETSYSKFPSFTQANIDSLKKQNQYLTGLGLRMDSLVAKGFNPLNTAVWKNMNGVTARLDSSIGAYKIEYKATLSLINSLQAADSTIKTLLKDNADKINGFINELEKVKKTIPNGLTYPASAFTNEGLWRDSMFIFDRDAPKEYLLNDLLGRLFSISNEGILIPQQVWNYPYIPLSSGKVKLINFQ